MISLNYVLFCYLYKLSLCFVYIFMKCNFSFRKCKIDVNIYKREHFFSDVNKKEKNYFYFVNFEIFCDILVVKNVLKN